MLPGDRLILADTLAMNICRRNAISSIGGRKLVPIADTMTHWNRKPDGIVPETDWVTVELHGVWGRGRTGAGRLGKSEKSSGADGRFQAAGLVTSMRCELS